MSCSVTIGIPVFKDVDTIEQSLESALSQTYNAVEFLIVDDCGNDGSMLIVDELIRHHPRGKNIRVIRNEKNVGVSRSRNRIIEEARGGYLYFMDADDVIQEDTISLMIKEAQTKDADIVFGSMEKILLSGRKVVIQYPRVFMKEENEFANFAYRCYAGIQASSCNFLVRLSLLRMNNLRFYSSNYWEDFVFVLDLVTYIQRAVLLPQITYTYICRSGTLSNFQFRKQIDKTEIMRNINVANFLKEGSSRLKGKPYFPQRCYVAMMTEFYIACHIMKRRRDIVPSISNKEISNLFVHPATFGEICGFSHCRMKNVFLFLLGKMPPVLCVAAIWGLGKYKRIL